MQKATYAWFAYGLQAATSGELSRASAREWLAMACHSVLELGERSSLVAKVVRFNEARAMDNGVAEVGVVVFEDRVVVVVAKELVRVVEVCSSAGL